jgi:hypothetical protein
LESAAALLWSARAAVAVQYFAAKLNATTIAKNLVRNSDLARAASKHFRAKIAAFMRFAAIRKDQGGEI